MKITHATAGKELNAPLDPRFGSVARFLIYDLGNVRFEVADKQNLNTAHSTGIQSTEIVVRLGAKALATGHCGSPKAFRVLQAAGKNFYNAEAVTVVEALTLYSEGRLNRVLIENVRGYKA